jgi:hypothetical protein
MSIEDYQTEDGRREDLEALETNPVIGYIGNKIVPVVNVATKAGKVYYKTLTADSAAQTDRTTGEAPARTLLTDSNQDWSASETIKRYGVTRDEVKQMGGIEQADKLGGKASKRSVQRAHEELVAELILETTTIEILDIQSSFLGAVQTALETIRRYTGRTAFVVSALVFNRIMKYTEILNRFSLSSAVLGGADALAVIASQPKALKNLLQGILGVDEILIGDDDQWATANRDERAAVIKLPPEDEFSHKMDAVYGKNMLYLPDGKQPYTVESFWDPNDKVNNYDAEAWNSLEEFNVGAAVVLEGIDESNTVVTSTTSA